MRAALTVLLLLASNVFMTWAWYGHLKKVGWTIPVAIGVSWLIALPEYVLHVPANRIGHAAFGGPFTAAQLKVLQEAVTLTVFLGFATFVLGERPRVNELVAFVLILAGVAVAMLGRGEPPVAVGGADAPTDHAVPAVEGGAPDRPAPPGLGARPAAGG